MSEEVSRALTRALAGFGIEASVENVSTGAAVERYELALGPGTKVQSLTKHSQDLAVALGARSVRIQAPIPGTKLVGVEVPADERAVIELDDLTEDLEQDHPLRFPVGVLVDGRAVSARLDKCPHLLIAGTTGSGKSVAMTSIITHLVEVNSPATLELGMIDPKRVELSMFEDLPHLYAPVATDPLDGIELLERALGEMEDRYTLMQDHGVRSIAELPETERPPYLVLVIDEMADLMLVGKKRAENAVVRLLQVGRAAGIHLLMATQRPSADVITGLIKANAPSRLVFSVQSHVDSNVALGQSGAETLLGAGDGLWWPGGEPEPMRIQAPYLSTEEIKERMERLTEPAPPPPPPSGPEANQQIRDDVFERLRAHREAHDAATAPTAPTPPSPPEPEPEPVPEVDPEPEVGEDLPVPQDLGTESVHATVQRLSAQLAEARAAFEWADGQRRAAYDKGRDDERQYVAQWGGKRLPTAADYWAGIGLAVAVLLVFGIAFPLAPMALAAVAGVWIYNRRLTSYQRIIQRERQLRGHY